MSRTDYSHGLIKANKDIDALQKSVGPSRSQSIAERRHDKADGRMWTGGFTISFHAYYGSGLIEGTKTITGTFKTA